MQLTIQTQKVLSQENEIKLISTFRFINTILEPDTEFTFQVKTDVSV
jgi:hypothetical protein